MNIEDGGSAFPEPGNAQCGGMSLRDYFAAKAMQAYVTRGCMPNDGFDERVSKWAYEMAYAMLAARSA